MCALCYSASVWAFSRRPTACRACRPLQISRTACGAGGEIPADVQNALLSAASQLHAQCRNVHNFSAGPATMRTHVVSQLARDMVNFEGSGMGAAFNVPRGHNNSTCGTQRATRRRGVRDTACHVGSTPC
jgi:hypothetical protein